MEDIDSLSLNDKVVSLIKILDTPIPRRMLNPRTNYLIKSIREELKLDEDNPRKILGYYRTKNI